MIPSVVSRESPSSLNPETVATQDRTVEGRGAPLGGSSTAPVKSRGRTKSGRLRR